MVSKALAATRRFSTHRHEPATGAMSRYLASLWSPKAVPEPAPQDAHLPLSSFLSWIPESLHPILRPLLIRALRLGPRPQHVAFIMDGNRRYARTKGEPVRVGHEEGFEALKRVLSFFLKLDIPHVTVYAFSIENFNRDPKEVEALMDMARLRLVEICEKGCVPGFAVATCDGDADMPRSPCRRALLDRHGVQIRILGRRDLLPPDVQESCARAEAMTANNSRCAPRSLVRRGSF